MNTSKESPLISVIIPVYNVDKYIDVCINSVLNQQISLEIILINDGSTDQSGDILNKYHKKGRNIKIIHQLNKGLSATRNRGLQIASGEYIAFVDSDDLLKKDSLSVLYNTAKKNHVDMIMGNILFYNSNKKNYTNFTKTDKSIQNIVYSGKMAFIELMKTGSYLPMVCSFIYRREWLIKSKIQFQDLLHEDELWTPLALCHATRVIILNHDFYYYRQRENSIMQTLNPEKRISSLFSICDHLIQLTNINTDKELFSWLYVKIFQLYGIAFSTLSKVRTSQYTLPLHQLHIIHEINSKLNKTSRQICQDYFLSAKKDLNNYMELRQSPWFNVHYNPANNKTLILVFNTMWNEPLPLNPQDVPSDCLITTDRQYLSVADAIVFHIPTLYKELEDDLEKPEGQIWIAWSLECEENYPVWKDDEFMSLFDLRMSYHQHADIIYPYYERNYIKSIYEPVTLSDKINKCCAFISSGFNQSNRREYLAELMKYTEVDSYGKLFNNSKIPNDLGKKTRLEIYSMYKFIIAFENSIAIDYVTEKFFDPLLAGSVPIYLGAPNVHEYSPGKNCFIDTTMFESPKELAAFINKCNKDDVLYSQFFQWKNQTMSVSFLEKMNEQKVNPFIRLCEKVKKIK